MCSFASADICRQAYVSDKFKMFSFLYQTLFYVIHSRKKYHANIYHLTRSKFYILLQQKSCANGGLEILSKYSCKQIAECKFYCANRKLVLITDLYKLERFDCGKNDEIFIS